MLSLKNRVHGIRKCLIFRKCNEQKRIASLICPVRNQIGRGLRCEKPFVEKKERSELGMVVQKESLVGDIGGCQFNALATKEMVM